MSSTAVDTKVAGTAAAGAAAGSAKKNYKNKQSPQDAAGAAAPTTAADGAQTQQQQPRRNNNRRKPAEGAAAAADAGAAAAAAASPASDGEQQPAAASGSRPPRRERPASAAGANGEQQQSGQRQPRRERRPKPAAAGDAAEGGDAAAEGAASTGEGAEAGKPKKQQKPRFTINYDELDVSNVTAEEIQKGIDRLKKKEAKKPVEEEFKAEIAKIRKKIEDMQEHAAKLREQMSKKKDGGEQFDTGKADIFKEVERYNLEIKAKQDERKRYDERIKAIEGNIAALKNDREEKLREVGGRVKNTAEIDEQIAAAEEEISQSSDAKTEKALITKIQKLKKSKEMLKDFTKLDAAIDQEYADQKTLRQRAGQLGGEIKVLGDERQKHRVKLGESNAERQKHTDEKQELYKKQKGITEKIRAAYEEIDAAYAKNREQYDKYWEFQRVLRTEEAKLKKKTYADLKKKEEEQRKKWAEEKAAREAEFRKKDDERKAELEEYEVLKKQNPFEVEISMTDALLKFFKSLKVQGEKRKQGKNKAGLTVPFDKVQALEQLKIAAPTSFAQIDETLPALEAKLKFFQSHIKSEDEVRKSLAEKAQKATAAAAAVAAAIAATKEAAATASAASATTPAPADALSPKETATVEQQPQA